MTKIILFFICLSSFVAMADTCEYTRHQQAVRSANTRQDVSFLSQSDIAKENPCGGNLMQLAVLRGNLEVFYALLENGGNVETLVSLADYPIDNAPDKIPFVLFAAKYSPSSMIIDTLINMGADMKVKDSKGNDIFWYLNQNPVLHTSYLTKKGYTPYVPLNERIKLARESVQK